eukprot:947100-Prorocentrum_minimum.AAC.1
MFLSRQVGVASGEKSKKAKKAKKEDPATHGEGAGQVEKAASPGEAAPKRVPGLGVTKSDLKKKQKGEPVPPVPFPLSGYRHTNLTPFMACAVSRPFSP